MHVAHDNPGKQLAATAKADHIAVWHSAAFLVPQFASLWLASYYLDGRWWFGLIPLIVATAIYGWRIDPRPTAPLDPYKPGDVTVEALNASLRAVGHLNKPTTARPTPDGVRLARLPRVVGGGQEIVFDLPPTVKASAADVVRDRERLAASLGIPLGQFIIETGEHPGRVVLWHSKRDPFSTAPTEHPLLDAERWSVFDPIPFGTDHRGRRISAPISGTHWLVGAVPNAGKTSAARGISAGAILDPDADLYVFDGKMGKDWSALEKVARQYEAGPIPEQAARLRALLNQLLDEGDARFQRMKDLPDDLCPDSAITPELARSGMPFVWLVIDEAHRHLGDEVYGQEITNLLIRYVKGYRAAGLGLLVCTQDAEGGIAERFTSLRRVTSTRFALRVMDWAASNMILGDSMNTRGWDASTILPSQQGTGILRGDLDADGTIDSIARTLRTYYLDNAAWRAICETGRALRQARPAPEPVVSTGPVEELRASDLLPRIRRWADEVLPAAVNEADDPARALGEYLSSAGLPAYRNGAGQRVRSRASVEVTLGLPEGRLQPVDEPTADDPADGSPEALRRVLDGATTGASTGGESA
jgi:hypothetical protein